MLVGQNVLVICRRAQSSARDISEKSSSRLACIASEILEISSGIIRRGKTGRFAGGIFAEM